MTGRIMDQKTFPTKRYTGTRILVWVGGLANMVVCFYAALLGIFNIIGSLTNLWFALFYFLMPLPFYLRDVFTQLELGITNEGKNMGSQPAWVWLAVFLGISAPIVFFSWSSSKLDFPQDLDLSVYVTMGLPVSMLIGAGCLLTLLLQSRSRFST